MLYKTSFPIEKLKEFIVENWRPNVRSFVAVLVFMIAFIALSPIVAITIPESFYALTDLFLLILATVAFYHFSDKKLASGFKFALLLSLAFELFVSVSSLSVENIIYEYLPILFNVAITTVFITATFMFLKNRKFYLLLYGLPLFIASVFIFDILIELLVFLFILPSHRIDVIALFLDKLLQYLSMSIMIGIPALLIYDNTKTKISGEIQHFFVAIGIIYTLLLLPQTIGLLLSFQDFQEFITLEVITGSLFGFNYLLIFILYGLLTFLFVEKKIHGKIIPIATKKCWISPLIFVFVLS